MKKFLALITTAILISVSTLQGVDLSVGSLTGTVTNLISVGSRVSALSIVNNGNVAHTFAFVDSPKSATTWTNGAYLATSSFLTNINYTITNFSGLVTNWYASNVLYTFTNTVAYTTNNFRVLFSGTIAAGPGTVLGITNQFATTYGLVYTNATLGTDTVNVTYSPNF